MLRLPKKGVQTPSVGLRGVSLTLRGGQPDPLSRGIPIQEVDSNPVSPPSASDRPTTEQIIREGVTRKATSRPEQNRPLGYQQTWQTAWKEAGIRGVCPAFTRKTGAMLKRAFSDWQNRHGSRHDFIHWSVVNWNAAVSTQLGWMKNPPAPTTPDPEFFARFVRHFLVAWNDRENTKWAGAQPGTRHQIEALKRKGMSEEAAILEVAKQQALSEDRRQRAAQLRAAETTLKMAQAARARSATRFTSENPHPRAVENRPLQLKAPKDDVGSSLPGLPEFPDD